MNIFSRIAEQRILQALADGEFDNLEGMGKPIDLSGEEWVPEDLRMSYRILKNAGCLPHELELRQEVLSLHQLLDTIDDDKERLKKFRELNFKLLKLNEMRNRPFDLAAFPEYEEKVFDRFLK